jgi:2-amino-4-hydroxy-6-hydroxymethyldihydropteridine diphosphokinase
VTDQPDFLNAVAVIDRSGPASDAAAIELLVSLKELERAFGRRQRRRWGPRELDLDLLLFGDARVSVERPPEGRPLTAAMDPGAAARLLEVPHPSMRDRLFVIAPLADLAPDVVPPGWSESIGSRAAALAASDPEAVAVVGTWDEAARDWV